MRHACDDEPEEILRRLEQQVRDLLSIMETKLYWPAQSRPEDDHNVKDGLENILHMELRLFQIVLSLKERSVDYREQESLEFCQHRKPYRDLLDDWGLILYRSCGDLPYS